MKLLFDEMLSDRLPNMLADIYPGSAHIFNVGLERAADPVIWDYAKNYDYIVTTKDSDYLDLSVRFGYPPKLILIRVANAPNRLVEAALRTAYEQLIAFSRSRQRVFELFE